MGKVDKTPSHIYDSRTKQWIYIDEEEQKDLFSTSTPRKLSPIKMGTPKAARLQVLSSKIKAMVAKESPDSKFKSGKTLRMLVIVLPIPSALESAPAQRTVYMELSPPLASTSTATFSVDMMKVIKLLLNKNNCNNK